MRESKFSESSNPPLSSMKKSHKPSNSNSNLTPKPTNGSVSSPSTQHIYDSLSQPHLVDLARCNHHRFWTSVTQKLKRCLTCFRPSEPRYREKEKGKMRKDLDNLLGEKTSRDDGKSPKNCNYYTEMNEEEKDEKLKSAISYCKDSKCLVRDPLSQFYYVIEISKYENLKVGSCGRKGIGDTDFERQRIPCPC